MTVTTAVFGAASGLFISLYSNGIRKLPLLRRPWEHALMMTFMGYLGHKYPSIEDSTLARVNAMRADRKLEPLSKNVWGYNVSAAEMSGEAEDH